MPDMSSASLQYVHKLVELSPVIISIFVCIGKQTKSCSQIWADLESCESYEQVTEDDLNTARRDAEETEVSLRNPYCVAIAVYLFATFVVQFLITDNALLSFIDACIMLPILALMFSSLLENLGGYACCITPKIGSDGRIVFVKKFRRGISILMRIVIFFVSSVITWRALWPGLGQKAAEIILCVAFITEVYAEVSGDFVIHPRLDESLKTSIESPILVIFLAAIFGGRMSGRFFGYETGFGHIAPWVWMLCSAITIEMDTLSLFMVYRFDRHRGVSSNVRLPATHFYFWPVVAVFCTVLVVSPVITVFTSVDFNMFNFAAIVVPFAESLSAFACQVLAKARGHTADLESYKERWPKMLEDEISARKVAVNCNGEEARSLLGEKNSYSTM